MTDWDSLRRRSLQPAGFGDDRAHIWPRLLNVDPTTPSALPDNHGRPPHRDEHQIELDTDRSFVLYPNAPADPHRTQLQSDLHALIVSLFRKRSKLSYFQGYHDIVSVILLTLPRELQFVCVEKLSLHRLRDSMGAGLEPVLGLLRVMKNLIRLADPEMAAILEQSSQLPFFALSNLLTLFSHDMPTLPLIQHVFDYLLCRPPIAIVYLTTAITLSRKEQVRRLQEEGEEGMIHSLLSGLPDLVDDPEPVLAHEPDLAAKRESDLDTQPDPDKAQLTTIPPFPNGATHQVDGNNEEEASFSVSPDDTNTTIVAISPSPGPSQDPEDDLRTEIGTEGTLFSPPPDSDLTLVDIPEPLEPPNLRKVDDQNEGRTTPMKENFDSRTIIPTTETESNWENRDTTVVPVTLSHPSTPTTSPSPPPRTTSPPSLSLNGTPPFSRKSSASPPPSLPTKQAPPPLTLSSLLIHADTLYTLFPPTHPSLSLSQTMGPQSVIYTWSENFRRWPDDTMAEAMVTRPELVVYPYVEPPDEESDFDADSEDDRYEEARKGTRTRGKDSKRRRRKLKKTPKQYQKEKEKKEKKRVKLPHVGVEKRTVLAGMVVVLGIAMAMYNVKSKPSGSGSHSGSGLGGFGFGGGFGGLGKSGNGRHWPWSW